MEPKDVTELLQSHDKSRTDEGWLLWISKESSFLSWDLLWCRCCEDYWNDNKRFRILQKFSDKAVAGFERFDSNFERCSLVGVMLSSSITCYRAIVHGRKTKLMPQTSLLSCFKKLLSRPTFSSHHPISQQPPTPWQDPFPTKRLQPAESLENG